MAGTRDLDDQLDSDAASPGSDTVVQGRYRLQGEIGRGGMATVFRAIDVVLDRPVAVKLLHPGISSEPQFADQFLRMERHIARLFHPNLVTIYDAGTTDGRCFAVMEYVAGGSLRDLLKGSQPLPASDVVRLIAQVADAMELLHSERIIHGDIKPDNILLDSDGNAKLADFGIAHLATITGGVGPESLSGSVPYLAPEQLETGRADARTDIYALALVTYELLVGRKAFDGENWVAVAAQRLARDPDPPRTVRPDLPEALEAAVMRSLARDPAERYATATEFREALLKVTRPATQDAPSRSATTRYAMPGLSSPVRPAARRGPGRGALLRRLLRGEHSLSVPVAAAVIGVDLLLLAVILALRP